MLSCSKNADAHILVWEKQQEKQNAQDGKAKDQNKRRDQRASR